jgi:hypothetical protein
MKIVYKILVKNLKGRDHLSEQGVERIWTYAAGSGGKLEKTA